MIIIEGECQHRGYADLGDRLDIDPAGCGDPDTDQKHQQNGKGSYIEEPPHNQADNAAQYNAGHAVNALFQRSLDAPLCNQNRRQRGEV
ncbi:hypothetical protein D3C75_789010 [compost metagenome]